LIGSQAPKRLLEIHVRDRPRLRTPGRLPVEFDRAARTAEHSSQGRRHRQPRRRGGAPVAASDDRRTRPGPPTSFQGPCSDLGRRLPPEIRAGALPVSGAGRNGDAQARRTRDADVGASRERRNKHVTSTAPVGGSARPEHRASGAPVRKKTENSEPARRRSIRPRRRGRELHALRLSGRASAGAARAHDLCRVWVGPPAHAALLEDRLA